jgi:ferritin
MLKDSIMKALNDQVRHEAESSQAYLAMAVWAETNGWDGTAQFLYAHSDEERVHMLKLMRFINERGGEAQVPALRAPQAEYPGVKAVFEAILHHETKVTEAINEVVDLCLKEKDYTTHNFMQWYVSEQIEEEALARQILDKLTLAGDDKGALYMFDRDIIGFGDHGGGSGSGEA